MSAQLSWVCPACKARGPIPTEGTGFALALAIWKAHHRKSPECGFPVAEMEADEGGDECSICGADAQHYLRPRWYCETHVLAAVRSEEAADQGLTGRSTIERRSP